MSATSDEAMRLLREIHAMLSSMRPVAPPPTVDLDGPHGDPILKAKDPRDWSGQTQVGKRMSECPSEYLDLLATRYDYFAGKETDSKKAGYNRLDAALARGWAVRVRAGGGVHPATPESWGGGKW